MTTKRIIAILGIAVLGLLYIATFISALFTTEATPELFKACVYATIVIPVLLYGYLLIYKLSKQRAEDSRKQLDETIASMGMQEDDSADNSEDDSENVTEHYSEDSDTDS